MHKSARGKALAQIAHHPAVSLVVKISYTLYISNPQGPTDCLQWYDILVGEIFKTRIAYCQ